jgi:hypothetical protein
MTILQAFNALRWVIAEQHLHIDSKTTIEALWLLLDDPQILPASYETRDGGFWVLINTATGDLIDPTQKYKQQPLKIVQFDKDTIPIKTLLLVNKVKRLMGD